MKTLTPEGGSREEVEALGTAMRALAADQDWSRVAERALTFALDLTGASISFIGIDDQADGGRHFYSKAFHPSAELSDDAIDPLITATAPIGSSCVQTLVAGGRSVGTIGGVKERGVSKLQRGGVGVPG